MLAVGLASVAAALLILILAVVPVRERVPLSRLDPSVAAPTSALAGAGVAAGAAVVKVLATLGLGALGTVMSGLLVGLLAVVAVPLGARLYIAFRTSRRRAAFADQLDDSLQLMASSLRAGHSILRAIDAVAQEAAAPTSDEFAAIVNQTRMGRDLSDALDALAERMGSDDFSWAAQAIAIQREVGGNLAEVLDAVGHTIRERNAIRRQVKALSAEGKLSAAVLMALPVGVVAFLSVANPSYLAGFTESALGFGMLATAVVMMTVGGLWLKRTVKIRF
jgi:tight adherence protein B